MNKAQWKKFDRAIARAPAPGHCPLAPPRRALVKMKQAATVATVMREKYIAAMCEMDAVERKAEEHAAKYLGEFLKNEDLMMRVQHLEKQLEQKG